jgi:aminoglycoside 3-N-acetyltransferase
MTTERETRDRIMEDLLALGVRPGGLVLMHSSLSSLGYVPGGPESVIQGLIQALGDNGTLLLPALSYEYVGKQNPVFDVLRTPSCVGAIPEYFRLRPGTLRSVHPTHSVCAIGAQAPSMTGDHHLDHTPVGPHSPFRKVRDLGGQLLFLGCGLRPNTSMHGVEELAEPPYLYGEMIRYRVILADGRELTLDSRHHGFQGYGQRYDCLEPLLDQETELRTGKVLDAQVHLIEAQPMWGKALAAYRRDPLYFVEQR